MNLPMGTRSLLYGAHQFLVHPFFLLLAWRKLGSQPPMSLPLLVSFVVHDWGLWGKPNMDGPEGTLHPEKGAALMGLLFGPEWASFTIRHSRRYAALEGLEVSALCNIDKLATALVPLRFYVALVTLTGEWREYATVDQPMTGKWTATWVQGSDKWGWAEKMQRVIREVTLTALEDS